LVYCSISRFDENSGTGNAFASYLVCKTMSCDENSFEHNKETSSSEVRTKAVYFIHKGSLFPYLLRFSDRIDRMNAYGNFFIRSQLRNDFLTRGKSLSSNQKSAVKMNQSVRNAFALLLAPLQSSFTEVCGVFTSLLQFSQFSRKLAINHRQWRKVRTGFSL